MPKGTGLFAAYVAGVMSTVTLAYFFWKSQIPPPIA